MITYASNVAFDRYTSPNYRVTDNGQSLTIYPNRFGEVERTVTGEEAKTLRRTMDLLQEQSHGDTRGVDFLLRQYTARVTW